MLNLDPASRRRAVKRLLFSWHPDKNPGREEFCTKVFQLIQHYVDLLELGKDLPDDDDDDVVDSGSSHSYQSYQSYSSSCSGGYRRRGRRWFGGGFFENVFSRGSDYARSRTSYYGSSQVRNVAMTVLLSLLENCLLFSFTRFPGPPYSKTTYLEPLIGTCATIHILYICERVYLSITKIIFATTSGELQL